MGSPDYDWRGIVHIGMASRISDNRMSMVFVHVADLQTAVDAFRIAYSWTVRVHYFM